MKLQSFLSTLISILPLTYAQDPEPPYIFDVTSMRLGSANGNAGPWSYEVYVARHNDMNTLANCGAIDSKDPSSALRLKCEVSISVTPGVVPSGVQLFDPQAQSYDLVNELNVTIQQPDDRIPWTSGFNVLINWR